MVHDLFTIAAREYFVLNVGAECDVAASQDEPWLSWEAIADSLAQMCTACMYVRRSRLFPQPPAVSSEVPSNTSSASIKGTQPESSDDSLVRFVDVGCGFGGLLIRLAPLYPQTRILGFELRDKVRTPFMRFI